MHRPPSAQSDEFGLTYGFHRAHPTDEIYRLKGYDFVFAPGADLAQAVHDWCTSPLVFQPGSGWNYSVSVDVLGRLIEIWSGQSFESFLQERILGPLGMTDTDWFCPQDKWDRLAQLLRTHGGDSFPFEALATGARHEPRIHGDDWGLGVFKDDGSEFHGGVYGDERSDDPKHGSTAYVAPIHEENFDHNIVYEHRTDFVVGKLADIRKRFNDLATRTLPTWHFVKDRQHWTVRNATDQGFPLNGEWRIKFGAKTPRLESAIQCWRAESAPSLDLAIAYHGQATRARIFWRRLDDDKYDPQKSLSMDLASDGRFHKYHLDLASSPEYRDLIIGLAIEPVTQTRPGEESAINSVLLSAERR